MLKRSILVIIVVVILLWGFGVIPKAIGEVSAKNYVSAVHSDIDLIFAKMEFSSAHGAYFAAFYDPDGNRINFLMSGGRFLPLGVWKDPLKNPI